MKHTRLVDASKIYLSAIYIKLGPFKNFVKVIDIKEKRFTRIFQKFSYKSETMLKQGIFVGPEIKKLLKNDLFKKILAPKELVFWELTSFPNRLKLSTRHRGPSG